MWFHTPSEFQMWNLVTGYSLMSYLGLEIFHIYIYNQILIGIQLSSDHRFKQKLDVEVMTSKYYLPSHSEWKLNLFE